MFDCVGFNSTLLYYSNSLIPQARFSPAEGTLVQKRSFAIPDVSIRASPFIKQTIH